MTMVCGLDLHRRQITFDALEVETGEVWRGRIWRPDRQRFRRWLREDVAERGHGEAVALAVVHRVALRRRGDRRRRPGSASGRAGRHSSGPGPQEAGQDGSQRRPAAEGASGLRRAARVVDSADGGVGVAGSGAALQVRVGPAPGVDPAHPRRALPARHRPSRRRDPLRGDAALARRRHRLPQPRRPPAHRRRISHDRCHRRRTRAAEDEPAALRSAPAGLSGSCPGSLWHRTADRGGRVVRAR